MKLYMKMKYIIKITLARVEVIF